MADRNEKSSFSTVLRKIGDCEESIFLVFYWPPTDFVSVYKNANMNKTNIQSPWPQAWWTMRLRKDAFKRPTSTGSGLFFIFERCFCPKFWKNRLYSVKDTQKCKFGSVEVLQNEKDHTSSWLESLKNAFAFQLKSSLITHINLVPRDYPENKDKRFCFTHKIRISYPGLHFKHFLLPHVH